MDDEDYSNLERAAARGYEASSELTGWKIVVLVLVSIAVGALCLGCL